MPTPTAASETKHLLSPKEGGVLITAETKVTEREIAESRNDIVARLDGTYRNLIFEMKDFQASWDTGPMTSLAEAAIAGGHAGSAEWLSEQEEMLHATFWNDLGSSIKKATGAALDRSEIYIGKRYDEIKKSANARLEKPEETILNWAWWQKKAVDANKEAQAQHQARTKAFSSAVSGTAESARGSVDMAKKIFHHREAILKLPVLIAEGKPRPIQAFVETVLMDIDPVLAKEIRYSKNFSAVLAILEDHDSALSYLSYAGLMFEAIPPNFYVYIAGKGGATLLIELILLIITALLSAGTAAAARIAMLVARLASAGAKVVSTNRHIKRARVAVAAVMRMVEDFLRAANELIRLGYKLVEARTKGFVLRGRTKTTLHAKKEATKRDAKCKLCGSQHHTTPRRQRGVIEYE